MRKEKDQHPKREVALKASKKIRKDMHSSKVSSSDELDEEEANFVKKLTRGIDKHKGKISLKCFDYGRIGHFSLKFPYAKNENEETSTKKGKKNKFQGRNKSNRKKKVFYSKHDNTLNEEDSDSDSESEHDQLLFMDMEDENGNLDLEDFDCEGEVNMGG